MKALYQSWKSGEVRLVDIPAPTARPGRLVVRTRASVVSVGTERAMIELAGRSLLGKALARPDLLQQVVAKAQSDGILEAWRQAMSRLDTPVPLGYSSAGVVVEVGSGVNGVAPGDPVACTGSGHASHAEIVAVPAMLCVPVPSGVDFEAAAFAALGGIALQAMRVGRAAFGELVVVIGLGLLGQLTVQLLGAAGCKVIGMDPDPQRASLALAHGADATAQHYETLETLVHQHSGGYGADVCLILASTTSNEPLEQAAALCRERGRVVATGLVGLTVPRKLFYEKELELVVSRAWGPGVYDAAHSDQATDYPFAYARWSARRNVTEFLRQLAKGSVRVDRLITHRFPLERAHEAYALIRERREPHLGVVLTYPEPVEAGPPARVVVISQGRAVPVTRDRVGLGVIGAGTFARGTLLPLVRGIPAFHLRGVATASGLTARHVAERFGFEYCTTEYQELLEDNQINLVLILTRHDLHAHLVVEAIRAGKHVFVEKPLALTAVQLREVIAAMEERPPDARPGLMVGFNRRFSPFTEWIAERFRSIGSPEVVDCTINAGPLPPDSWVYDPVQGGGRLISEACHFIDLVTQLTQATPVRVFTQAARRSGQRDGDTFAITLEMENRSIGIINYTSGGDRRFPRERVEVFGGGGVGVIDNFRRATFTARGRRFTMRGRIDVDRGHKAQLERLLEALRTGVSAVPFEEYIAVTLATLVAERSRREGVPVSVRWDALE